MVVVSKDTKRKRKGTSPPPQQQQQAQQQQQQPTLMELSSPELPKRTKVQAQRKFAQGQGAPSTSYNSLIAAASSSSNTGPSTSSESREPPTEILPNKRPKTEDFLTFLCFRGTSALPAHLDFLNQGNTKETAKKLAAKPTAPTKPVIKKGKRGRKPKAAAATANAEEKDTNEEEGPSTSAALLEQVNSKEQQEDEQAKVQDKVEDKVQEKLQEKTLKGKKAEKALQEDVTKTAIQHNEEAPNSTNDSKKAELPVVEVVAPTTTGRRGRPARNAPELEKCNSPVEDNTTTKTPNKRRSNRAGAARSAKAAGHESEEDEEEDLDEDFSTHDRETEIEAAKPPAISRKGAARKQSKTPVPAVVSATPERNIDTPSKESEVASVSKSRKGGRPASVAKKEKDVVLTSDDSQNKTTKDVKDIKENTPKEKQPIKRPRQKESPIFIPSPEPSGRMTRQRAFFEPVKVPHRDEKEEGEKENEKEKEKEMEKENDCKEDDKTNKKSDISTSVTKKAIKEDKKLQQVENSAKNNHEKSSLDVFDFSSDDEQPLAKAMKAKKGKGRGGKKSLPLPVIDALPAINRRQQQTSPKKTAEKVKGKEDAPAANEKQEKPPETVTATPTKEAPASPTASPTKAKAPPRGRNAKKKAAELLKEQDDEKEPNDEAPPAAKKATGGRQPRKSAAAKALALNGDIEDTPIKENQQEEPQTTRSQRPMRKTKEAATIYMGIIGQKLQMADDEDDDLSLNSFPDLPNVKEMEKMETEMKKKKNQAASPITTTSATTKPTKAKSTAAAQTPVVEKPTPVAASTTSTGRRGRPPKQAKQSPPLPPVKREIEGMLVKKGSLAKLVAEAAAKDANKAKSDRSAKAVDTDDEDFLLNEAVKETKRKLEKSFSDSDDEPLAIKAHVKGDSDKDGGELDSRKSDSNGLAFLAHHSATHTSTPTPTPLAMLPLTTKPLPPTTHPLSSGTGVGAFSQLSSSISPLAANPFKATEKKSPVPTSKITNVPAMYAVPSTTNTMNSLSAINASFNKSSTYLAQPSASPSPSSLYHTPLTPHARLPPPTPTQHQHQYSTAKSPAPGTLHTSPTMPQSPIKYQTQPTTYPPPIEAYPSPKINPNFLTPKFDRTTTMTPRSNNFPSPMKYDLTSSTSKLGVGGMTPTGAGTTTLSPKTISSNATPGIASSTAAAAGATASASADPLKDEIGSILAANLMPSKEESGKIFGIASVSLAQSSGPDNTKCTLGKCGSIHKPVLGPVVPTEGYIGDQLSSKERRKAKVNMTHEQIQKWLIECSSNPDAIQDDLEDDADDNLRPNLFATTPPPTRDDKESTSFSSSSKTTRDLGKSESAWSAKGPSLKATPVVASTSRTKDDSKQMDQLELFFENEKSTTGGGGGGGGGTGQAINLSQKTTTTPKKPANTASELKEKEKEREKEKKGKDKDDSKKEPSAKDNKQIKKKEEKEAITEKPTTPTTATDVGKLAQSPKDSPPTTPTTTTKGGNKRKTPAATAANTPKATTAGGSNASGSTQSKLPKRTPVYNQKQQAQEKQQQLQKLIGLKETTTTSHKRQAPFSYGAAFSADNEKSIYSFDKDDAADEVAEPKSIAKAPFRPKTGSKKDKEKEKEVEEEKEAPKTTTAKKRGAATEKTKANADAAVQQKSSVSLTLSPLEKSKLVKVGEDAEKAEKSGKTAATKSTSKAPAKDATSPAPTAASKDSKKPAAAAGGGGDSDSEGHTFYIPLQGSGTGAAGEGIQGVALKLGREGPDGPNQKVIMHATLVTKAQMGTNSKPLPDSMNVTDIVKALNTTQESGNKKSSSTALGGTAPSTSAQAAAAAAAAASLDPSSASNSLKNVPIGTVQPRFKGTPPAVIDSTATLNSHSQSGLVRVNSNSSLLSGSVKSRNAAAALPSTSTSKKFKDDAPIKMSNNTAFPRHDDPPQMVDAPIFRPTEKEFADPIEFIERITPIAARFGICKIIPPATFKPECRISDEMRFTAYNQYIHKMLHRWGPSVKELSAIRKYLATQSIVMNHPPWIGGMEVDLPRLYHTVQELGGLKEVIEKKKWARVAEEMCIPKLAQDRVTKLDDIYCKYLLPYDTLSPAERQKLFDEVEADWAKREARARRNADRFVNTESVSNEEDDITSEDDDDSEEEVDGVSMECIVKGRSMALSQFYRIARNTMALWFKNTEPTVSDVEVEFWRHVAVRDSHVCVHSGSIDSSGWGYGFPSPGPKGKGSNYARHPWNLKVLTNNTGSVLRSLGPVMGVTVPTLHVGMLFSACCWYRDPHGLSWIEYLHTGASKLWYGIPDDQSANFRAALTSLIPTHCQNKTIWLPCDTVMVPPHILTDRGVSLCRIEQKPGEFIVVFPRAYTSSLATGYVVSESVYFATSSWLDLAKNDFKDIHESCEPAMFSLEQLLFAMGHDQRVTTDSLQQMLPMLQDVCNKETAAREQLKAAGVTSTEKAGNDKAVKNKKQQPPFKSIESECDLCRANLYISMVKTEDGNIYCLQHALKNLNNGNIQAKQCKLIYAYNVDDIQSLIRNLMDRIQQKRSAVVNKKAK